MTRADKNVESAEGGKGRGEKKQCEGDCDKNFEEDLKQPA